MATNNKWKFLTPLKFFYTGDYSLIEPTICGSRFSTGRVLAIEEFTFFLPLVRDPMKIA